MPHRYQALKDEWFGPDKKFKTLNDTEFVALNSTLGDYYNIYRANQHSVKLSANSLYGASGTCWWRFCNYDLAGDITGEGKHHMIAIDVACNKYFQLWESDTEMEKILQGAFPDQTIKLVNNPYDFRTNPKMGDVCNYGDTDSRYIEYAMVFKMCGFKPKNNDELIKFVELMDVHRISPLFNKTLVKEVKKKNGNPTLKMELEIIGGRGIFRAKKMYVISTIWKDGVNISSKGKLKSVGVELKRKTSSAFIKQMQSKLIRALLTPTFPVQDIYKLSAKIVQHAKTQDTLNLCKITTLNKYDEYVLDDKDFLRFKSRALPSHKGSARWNSLLYRNKVEDRFDPILNGQKLKYYIADDGTPIAFPMNLDVLPDFIPPIHYAKQIEMLLLKPLKSYLPEKMNTSNLGKSVIQNSFK